MEKKGHGSHCCDTDNLLKCMCAIDQEIAYFKECGFGKHVNHLTREKILFCMIMRDLAKMDKKLDKILCELNSDWCSSSDNFCSDSSNSSDSSDSSHCSHSSTSSGSESHGHWHCPKPHPHKCKI